MARNGSADCPAKRGFLGPVPLKNGKLSSFTSLVWPLTRIARPTYPNQRADHFRIPRQSSTQSASVKEF
jgi:hypothetical protein